MVLLAFKVILNSLLIWICVLCVEKISGRDIYEENAFFLVRQWAPKIWLDPEERFFPSSVPEFLKHVTPVKINCTGCAFRTLKLPVESDSEDFFLITRKRRDDLLKNKSSILYGNNPAEKNVATYAFVTPCDSSFDHFLVTYWFFYPFNQGKEVCNIRLGKSKVFTSIFNKLFKKCLGSSKILYGNHVGDWEHMSLEIKNGTPSAMYLSVHNVGVYYRHDPDSNSFVVSHGRAQGLSEIREPPPAVRLEAGHPVLFAAKGSHALWGSVGSHMYTRLHLRQLVDVADYGTPWETWQELQVFIHGSAAPVPEWFQYRGRWGNPSSGCLPLSRLVGASDLCLFSSGPPGLPLRRPDFTCPLPLIKR